jgi:hypothetical protein
MGTERLAFDDRPPNDESVTPAALGDCAFCSAKPAQPVAARSGMMQIVRNLNGSQFHILYVTMSLQGRINQ